VPEGNALEALGHLLRSESVFSLIKITPSHLKVLSQLSASDKPATPVNAFVIGGEALQAESLSFWRSHAPHVRLINEYGPTETVVGCSIYEVKADTVTQGVVPIGRPIANTELYVLDTQLQPVPVGVCGELYVGGAGLARGYHAHPALTASRFIPHPFSSEPGARLYRTGDLARYGAEGELEFLGRSDSQVKVRGFRIELGEIETVVCGHEGVRQCAAMVREDSPGDKRVVAYVVPREGAQASLMADELRSFVALRLPDYMVPSTLMFLPELPLSVNGKIDRQRLPAPEIRARVDGARYVAPRTPLEEAVCDIWAGVLRVERVGVEDNFFELGGHSLLATQVISRVKEAFAVELPIGTLFERPTAAGMCEAIERARKNDAEQPRAVTTARAVSPVARRLQRVQVSQGVLTTKRKKN
jgi:acyl carrier protein